MKKSYVVLILCTCFALPCWSAGKKEKAQKPVKMSTLYKAASTAIKNASGQDGARTNLINALSRPDLKDKDKAEIYYTAAKLYESSNSVENRKAYLKQQYDTALFFNTLLNMYEQLRLCDSVDAVPNAQEKIRLKFSKKTNELRQKHIKNILNGSKYFLRKADYASAYGYIDAFYTHTTSKRDTLLYRLAYQAALCGYLTNQPKHTLKYIDKAIEAATRGDKPILQEYKVRTYALLKNDSLWVRELHIGVNLYPEYDYFFVNLVDWYNSQRMTTEACELADSLIKVVSADKAIYWYTKCKMKFLENDYEACIQFADSTIKRDASFVDAYYNKGISYLNMAVIKKETACNDIKDKRFAEDRKAIQELYAHAMPCIEKVRELQPDMVDRWGSPLYRIYLNLNKGKEFDEVDKLLKKKAEEDKKK
ncbi:MAG: hypothetical protein ACI4B5_09335 [Bacteroidaceae bacterium]